MPEARLRQRLDDTLGGGRRALIPYLTSGFPTPDRTLPIMTALADLGVDVIELGVPFSDPLADGPTIQRASQRALEAGGSVRQALDALAAFREARDTPVVLFSYLNPILAYGEERLMEDALAAGADGLLLTDLPLDADPVLEATIEASELALVRLIAPTTSPERAALIAARSQGFLYYISRTGVTGTGAAPREALAREVDALRASARVPIAVGFGISNAAQAAEVARAADGIVVGSAFIERLGRDEGVALEFMGDLLKVLDA